MKRSLSGLFLLGLAACGSDSTGSTGASVGSLVMSDPLRATGLSQTVQLSATAKASDGSAVPSTKLRWESLDPGIASVSGSGMVSGVSLGTARVVVSAGGKADTAQVKVVPGRVLRLNTNAESACSNPKLRDGQVVATTAQALFVEDVSNPVGGFTPSEYQEIANTFESLIWPANVETFGAPHDIDKNGKVIVFYTGAVNELTPRGAEYVVGGFFFARDLFPKKAASTSRLEACAGSNEAEMFYMLAVDPNGQINGHKRSKEGVRRSTLGTVAHEFQHLINASRRLFVNNASGFEETWLDEGLAHIAEELIFYRASGLAPRQNLGLTTLRSSSKILNAFNEYGFDNLARLDRYYNAPTVASVYDDNDELATRGAAWGFLRYAADRRGGTDRDLWYALANSTASGLNNLGGALGVSSPVTWVRDWTVGVYADDAGFTVEPRFTQPSWNYGDIFTHQFFDAPVLETRTLTDGAATSVSLRAGSAAYLRLGVPQGGTGELRIVPPGGTAATSCRSVSLALGEVFQGALADASTVCLAGGADYVVIPFHGSTQSGGTTSLTVTATGIVAPSASITPSRMLTTERAAAPGAAFGLGAHDASGAKGWEMRLRERERRELGRLLPQGPSRSITRQSSTNGPEVSVSILRVR